MGGREDAFFLLANLYPRPQVCGRRSLSKNPGFVSVVVASLALGEAMMMDEVLARSMGDYHSYSELLGIFAGIAVLLAVTGIYSVMSYFVNERLREFGIRVALGAQSADVLSMVAKTGLRIALIGVGVLSWHWGSHA